MKEAKETAPQIYPIDYANLKANNDCSQYHVKHYALSMVKAKISTRALLARVNRALAAEGQIFRRSRGKKLKAQLGEWHILDKTKGEIAARDLDIEQWARDRNLLQSWEEIDRD
jgi:hypothetical protein